MGLFNSDGERGGGKGKGHLLVPQKKNRRREPALRVSSIISGVAEIQEDRKNNHRLLLKR